jgi:hypothetical protein
LRRAIRYGFTFLNTKEPFINKLVEVLADQMGEFFPEIKSQQQLVKNVIREEEASFLRTLEQGLQLLDKVTNPQNYLDYFDGEIVRNSDKVTLSEMMNQKRKMLNVTKEKFVQEPSLFDKLQGYRKSETKKIARVCVELSGLSERLKAYLIASKSEK